MLKVKQIKDGFNETKELAVALMLLANVFIQFMLVSNAAFPLSFNGWVYLNCSFFIGEAAFWLFILKLYRSAKNVK